MTHSNHFLRILNGSNVTKLKAYSRLEFEIPMSCVNRTLFDDGRWNSQYTWGVSSMNIKQINANDIVNRPTIKSANVTDGMLPQFAVLSELLLEVDKDNKFYCGLSKGNDRRVLHAQSLMKEDPTILNEIQKKNVIESVSGICNVYSWASAVRHYSSMGVGTHQ